MLNKDKMTPKYTRMMFLNTVPVNKKTGGGGGSPAYSSNQPATGDSLGRTLGSILGGVLGGGGSHQQPVYQPSGGYDGGSALFRTTLDGLSKRGKDKSHDEHHSGPPSSYEPPPPKPRPETPPSSGVKKLTADEISKGLDD